METPFLDQLIDEHQNHIESVEASSYAGIQETRKQLAELEAIKAIIVTQCCMSEAEQLMENVETLKAERPDLVELFENMTREELLKQCYLECLDAVNMESRVALFMAECTNNMSKTNYTLRSLKSLISENKEREIDSFCYDVCDEQEDSEILKEIKERASNY